MSAWEGKLFGFRRRKWAGFFKKECSVISKHINNIINEGELAEKSNVQILHSSGSDRPVKLFNLEPSSPSHTIALTKKHCSKTWIDEYIWGSPILKYESHT